LQSTGRAPAADLGDKVAQTTAHFDDNIKVGAGVDLLVVAAAVIDDDAAVPRVGLSDFLDERVVGRRRQSQTDVITRMMPGFGQNKNVEFLVFDRLVNSDCMFRLRQRLNVQVSYIKSTTNSPNIAHAIVDVYFHIDVGLGYSAAIR
jgi:hypothetical protein